MRPGVRLPARHAVCALVLVVASGLLTACSFDPFAEEPATPTVNLVRAGRALSKSETKAMLPTGASAPSGYAASPKNQLKPTRRQPDEVVTPARCGPVFDDLDTDYDSSPAKSFATYVNSDKTYLGVGVASRLGRLVGLSSPQQGVVSCRRFTVKVGQDTIRVTAKPLSFPEMGEDSVAINMTLDSGGRRASYAHVRVQAGHNTVVVEALSATNEPPAAAMQEAADTMLLNLSR